jgi:hypothetical protein
MQEKIAMGIQSGSKAGFARFANFGACWVLIPIHTQSTGNPVKEFAMFVTYGLAIERFGCHLELASGDFPRRDDCWVRLRSSHFRIPTKTP